MLVLVLDSSTPAVTAALAEITADAVAPRGERSVVDARAHGELLAPQVSELLAEAGARPADLAAVVAGVGPGPFTGLRVGLVTAASMGQTLGIPTYGVPSLDAIGHAATHPRSGAAAAESGPVLVATDARRREIYWAVYDLAGQRLAGPEVDTPAAVAERARELGVRVAVGEGARRYADILGLPPGAGPLYPPPYALAELAAERVRAGAPGDQLTPLYLRRPDAVAAAGRKPVLQ
ncbi:tRNA (adenosine(37)-N6)-threonylcarbamoyltransferase complex dimerization subunit type 1 TsaB [Plantactinospora sp. B6F1]|uniref:tRNA (adenosine(37)-N6)-threonylcarbamoyltransferase complex dimerization subunit type 1 TsaB n=1 Tax=Plantactinospora sp. B6F1 TaxID=3158971 RepID=UPI0032D8FD86